MEKLAVFGGTPVTTDRFAEFPVYDHREEAALLDVLKSRVWGGYNPKVKEFEEAFADLHDTRYGITASNGTVTLETALLATGISHDDEVIVPPISFIATATAVLRVGAKPVFADIDPRTCNLDPAKLRDLITSRTRGVIPVHFAGHPADMDEILNITAEHDLVVIEDCAHAHGASWKGKSVGSLGDFGSFSFQASKNLTSGEGGILSTNDSSLAEAAWSICNQGRRTGGGWYEHVRLGTNYRLTGWQAAILLTQLSRLPEQIRTRQENAERLIQDLSHLGLIATPSVDDRVTQHSYYLFLLRLDTERLPGLSKQAFVDALTAEGIPCSSGYPYPLYKNVVFENLDLGTIECPEAEKMCRETFWLSHEVLLAPPHRMKDVTSAIQKLVESSETLAVGA